MHCQIGKEGKCIPQCTYFLSLAIPQCTYDISIQFATYQSGWLILDCSCQPFAKKVQGNHLQILGYLYSHDVIKIGSCVRLVNMDYSRQQDIKVLMHCGIGKKGKCIHNALISFPLQSHNAHMTYPSNLLPTKVDGSFWIVVVSLLQRRSREITFKFSATYTAMM